MEKKKSILIYLDDTAILAENGHFFSFPLSPPTEFKLKDVICVCDLSDKEDYRGKWVNMPIDKVAIDPVLGRIAFPPDLQSPPGNRKVHVSYNYGLSADIGGGEYNREATLGEGSINFIEIESSNSTIQQALDLLDVTGGTIEIKDNEVYQENLSIHVAAGKSIVIRAADGKRPTLMVSGEIRILAAERSQVIFNGLLIAGGCISNYDNSELKLLKIIHCTLVPSPRYLTKLIIDSSNTQIEISHSIVGELKIKDESDVHINNSIVDADDPSNVAFAGQSNDIPGGKLHITNSTIIGKVYTRLMEMASNTIFLATTPEPNESSSVRAQRLQEGCVRFSFFPEKSMLPKPFRCQSGNSVYKNRITPRLISLTYGDAGYCQLSQYCPKEIAEGADDGSEMGVFHDLYHPHKISNLRTRLDEYLRFGMKAGIFYAS